MIRQRVRIRFCKQDDLRWISHRDLVRVWERVFRRAGLSLSMSEGFHPKARMSFPLALSLGIASTAEVMEVELSEKTAASEVCEKITPQLPNGLVVLDVQLLDEGVKKAQAERVTYEIPIPQDLHDDVRLAMEDFMSQSEYLVNRTGRDKPLDIRADIESLRLHDGKLEIHQRVTRTASANPREILTALGLEHLEQRGSFLTRTVVEVV